MTPHPARLAAAFDPPIPLSVAERLLADARFQSRIDALLDGGDVPDRTTLEALAQRAGAVLYARSFVREIRGPVIADLAARLGPALDDARAHVDLGWDRIAPTDPDALAQAVDGAGLACLAAWIADLPEDERRRVALQWPDDAALPQTADPEIRTLGPRILRRLMESE
ncbi:hypothetical protein QCN27_06900 [Cereibacter sp. SYSU M97828]|nr:hypothetical protein [Cereibacter flavus]